MSFLCYDCTADFIAEIFADGYGLEGVSYVEPSHTNPSECDRCGRGLPESDELEAGAKHLLIRTVAVLKDRSKRAKLILEGTA